jgi:putative spermidine/putrescine transport system permease protein
MTTDLARPRLTRRLGGNDLWAATLPALPLAALLLVFFLLPLTLILRFSVEDRDVARGLPTLAAAVRAWDGEALPEPPVFAALVQDLRTARAANTLGPPAGRINRALPGLRSALFDLAAVAEAAPALDRDAIIALDPRWGDVATWRAIRSAAGPMTAQYLLAATDLTRAEDGAIIRAPEAERIHLPYLWRTMGMAMAVTAICAAIAFPMAYAMAVTLRRWERLLAMIVLLTFWTSILARTAAWSIILQAEGMANGLMMRLGLIDAPLQLLFTRGAVLLAMVHIMLPYMILPVYAAIRAFPWNQARAATSLGATPARAFVQVFLPQVMPGIRAGAMMVFVLSTGFYITPALLGGPGDQMLSALIAQTAMRTGNWGMAAALSLVLILSTALVLGVVMTTRLIRAAFLRER